MLSREEIENWDSTGDASEPVPTPAPAPTPETAAASSALASVSTRANEPSQSQPSSAPSLTPAPPSPPPPPPAPVSAPMATHAPAKEPIRAAMSEPAPAAPRPTRREPPRLSRYLFGVAGIVILLMLTGLIDFVLRVPSEETKLKAKADGIVVLTGGSSRVSDAMELLAQGLGKRLLISGVNPASGPNDISRTLPEFRRLLECCVDLDRSALNTRGNAAETQRWARERGFTSLIIVTSNYHMPRALAEMAHRMPEVKLVPYPVVAEQWRNEPWWTRIAKMRLLLVEYVKYVVVVVRLRLDDIGLIPDTSEGRSSAVPFAKSRATAQLR